MTPEETTPEDDPLAAFIGYLRGLQSKVNQVEKEAFVARDYFDFHHQHAKANREDRRTMERYARKRRWL